MISTRATRIRSYHIVGVSVVGDPKANETAPVRFREGEYFGRCRPILSPGTLACIYPPSSRSSGPATWSASPVVNARSTFSAA